MAIARDTCDLLGHPACAAERGLTHFLFRMMPLELQKITKLLIFVHTTLAVRIECAKDYYGTPSSQDCDSLLESFADSSDNQPRLFDDEQLRTPGGFDFPGVHNIYPTQVVQVPAYWSLGEFTSLSYNPRSLIQSMSLFADW